jgi:pimeloyl-ACP methyl ester carboxylesterase
LAAVQMGSRDGPAMVLVPGFTGSKEDFLPLLEPLAGAGLNVTAIDQRGQHESPGTGRLDDYRLPSFTADLIDVIGSRPAHLVGHSFGGLVCREVTLARPDLVSSLTLMDSGPGALPREHWDLMTALCDLVPVATSEQIWVAKQAVDAAAGVPALEADVEEFLHRRWVATDPWCLAGIAQTLMSVPDLTSELSDTVTQNGIPVLVMYGEDDTSAWPVPEMADMAARLAVPAVAIPGAAHSPAVENPQRTVREIIDFVSARGV